MFIQHICGTSKVKVLGPFLCRVDFVWISFFSSQNVTVQKYTLLAWYTPLWCLRCICIHTHSTLGLLCSNTPLLFNPLLMTFHIIIIIIIIHVMIVGARAIGGGRVGHCRGSRSHSSPASGRGPGKRGVSRMATNPAHVATSRHLLPHVHMCPWTLIMGNSCTCSHNIHVVSVWRMRWGVLRGPCSYYAAWF